MKIVFSDRALQDDRWWQRQERKLLRRIRDEHRLIYKVTDDEVRVAACRYLYE